MSLAFPKTPWTPGDWLTVVSADKQRVCASVRGQKAQRLIAAAPDLLEALQHAVRFHDQINKDDLTRYQKAIDRATGALE